MIRLLLLLAARALAQSTAEPQYNLPGSDFKTEAPAIQQMFQNVGNDVANLNTKVSVLQGQVVTGAALVAGTNVFTNVNRFTSTITVSGPNNWEVMIASGDAYGVTAATPTWSPIVSASSTSYRLYVDGMVLGGTATFPYLLVNGDNAASYAYAGRCENGGGGAAQPGATGARLIPLWETTTTGQNQSFWGSVRFATTYSKKDIWFNYVGGNTTNTLDACRIGGLYIGTGSATALTITTNSTLDLAIHWEIWEGQTRSP